MSLSHRHDPHCCLISYAFWHHEHPSLHRTIQTIAPQREVLSDAGVAKEKATGKRRPGAALTAAAQAKRPALQHLIPPGPSLPLAGERGL